MDRRSTRAGGKRPADATSASRDDPVTIEELEVSAGAL